MSKGKYTKDSLIKEIIDMRLKKHKSTRDILLYLESLGYKQAQRYQYMKWMREEIGNNMKCTTEDAVSDAIAKYEQAMEVVWNEGKHKIWNDMNVQLNKLKGLYIDRVEHTGEVALKDLNINIKKNKDD